MRKLSLQKLITYCSPFILLILVGSGYYNGETKLHRNGKKGFALNVPVSFNKTHFIVGLSATPVESFDYTNNQAGATVPEPQLSTVVAGCNKVYFSPDDDVQQKLIDLIDQEKREILLAIYAFSNKKIADALIAAHQRGIHVEVVVDPGFLSDRYTKIGILQEQGITVHMYNPQHRPEARRKTMSNIMHNKFVIFKQNQDNQSLIWTGSFNFTNSAHMSNQENVVVLNDEQVIQRYRKQFEELKKRSMLYQPH